MWEILREVENLTPEQRKELRAALESAFPEPQNLELMIYDEFEISFNSITQRQANYQIGLQKLVEWAESQGKLEHLLKGAVTANPGNPKLKKLLELWTELELIKSIKEILSGEYEKLRKEINEAYFQVLNQLFPRLIKTEEPDNLDTLINNLIARKNNVFDCNTLHYFVVYLLLDKSNLLSKFSPSLVQKLRNWVTNFVKDHRRKIESIIKEKFDTMNKEVPCILIRLEKVESQINSSYNIDAWFIENLNEYKSKNGSKKAIVILENNYEQVNQTLNVGKRKYTKEEIKGVFQQIIKNVEKYRPGGADEITKIHIFLPQELMNLEIETWKVEEEGKTYILFGNQYEIILRAAARLDRKYLLRFKEKWTKKWNKLQDDFSDAKLFEIPQSCRSINDIQKVFEMANSEKTMVLQISQPFSILPEKELNDLFDILTVESVIPLALWVRKKDEGNERKQVDESNDYYSELKEILGNTTLEKLALEIKGNRSHSIGKYLCLLWDDPELLPPGISLEQKNTITWD